jgi:tRNA G18 (ribose-2'-O)-methylase SpoU
MNRGYFAIGIEHTKTKENIGTLWRSAYLYGASFIFTIGKRYKYQASDTPKAHRHMPLFHFDSIDQIPIPKDCAVVGVEMTETSIELEKYKHAERCIYLLGAEDHGLSKEALDMCDYVIQIPCLRDQSMNVSVAGSIVLYDRFNKLNKK